MVGQKLIIFDNGPSYTLDVFTSVMNAYHVNHITSSPYYPQSNELAEKYVHIVKSLFHTAKEEGKDLFKCLLIYHNTPLSGSLQPLMQILQSRSARSDLPISNAARQQLEKLRNVIKMNICLHMIYILGKMLCIKMLQASGGIQPLFPAYVCSQEVTIYLQEQLLPTGTHKFT